MGAPLVELIGVSREFLPAVRALDGVSLTLDRGETVAIKGPSGSGKSTLLHILGLLDRPTEGMYRFDGLETTMMSERERVALRARQIGFVFQAYHLIPHLTVAENVALSLRYAGATRTERARTVARALTSVGLLDRADAYPPTLSGGEQQRAAIARALVREPCLLLCDEPTGNLDSESGQRVLALIDHLRNASRTIVLVTHDPAVASHADRLIRIMDGRVQGERRGARAAD
jgi:putative ABC transport system ATP-binding protein